jgi:sec-independent protein translocase protein TatA
MNTMLAGIFGGWEVVMILAAVLILFGAKKVPELMGGLGKGIKEFKKATRDVTDELNSAMDDHDRTPPPAAQRKLPAATVSTETEPVTHSSPEHKV